uniref:Uncharacterized protein n=1 Tax=Arcella intermedia TaxID=1963864 RepID=A0A6B2LUY5_9EUKA
MKYIPELHLGKRDIDDKEAKLLSQSLVSNSNLLSVDLEDNNIKDDGAKSIANLLQSNSSLTKLNLISIKSWITC